MAVGEGLAYDLLHAPHVARAGDEGAELDERGGAAQAVERLERVAHLLGKQAAARQRCGMKDQVIGIRHGGLRQVLGKLQHLCGRLRFRLLPASLREQGTIGE